MKNKKDFDNTIVKITEEAFLAQGAQRMSDFKFDETFENGLRPEQILWMPRKCYYHVTMAGANVEIQYCYSLGGKYELLKSFSTDESIESISDIVHEVLGGYTPEEEVILNKYIDLYTADDMSLVVKNLVVCYEDGIVRGSYYVRTEGVEFDTGVDPYLTDIFCDICLEKDKQLQFAKVMKLYVECERILGRFHSNTIAALHLLRDHLNGSEQKEQVRLTIDTEIYRFYKKNYGNAHTFTGYAINSIVWDLILKEEYKDAVTLAKFVYEREKEKQCDSRLKVCILLVMGWGYRELGRYGLAFGCLEECYSIVVNICKKDDWLYLFCLEDLAEIHRSEFHTDYCKAVLYDLERLRIAEEYYPEEIKYKVNCLCEIAHDHCLMKRYDQALKTQDSAVRLAAKYYGEQDYLTTRNQLRFCFILSQMGMYKEALAIELDIYELYVKLYGGLDRRSMRLLDDIIIDLKDSGDYDKAAEIVMDSYYNRRRHLGEDHEETVFAYEEYVELFGKKPDVLE